MIKAFIQQLRSVCFDIALYGFSIIYLLFCLPFLLINPRRFGIKILKGQMHLLSFLIRHVVGLTHQVKGMEHLQNALKLGPCLVACKHQSAWETIVLGIFFDSFTIVLKKELGKLPLFGFYLKKSNMIFIDRQSGRQSIKSMLIQSRQAIQQNQSILIFPEGTRTQPGGASTYQPGVGLLYGDLNIPVLPVALNSGLFWGRRSWVKKPGKVTIEFLPLIEPGLNRQDFMNRLEHDIESACEKLIHV